jgi:hypothetical protein
MQKIHAIYSLEVNTCCIWLSINDYLIARPVRLHCPTCEETYNLPQNGVIKLYQELQCPLDNFELVLFSFGSGQKSYPVCPYCYNYPTLEGMEKGLGCNQCPHPTCQHSLVNNSICECPECGMGAIVLGKFVLSSFSFLIYYPFRSHQWPQMESWL